MVWSDLRGADYDIYGYDLSTGQEFTVCTASGYQYVPAIYGDIVVSYDWRGVDRDIYGYNLSTGQEFTVCTAANDQDSPAIYGDVVVWEDDRGTDRDIYGRQIRFRIYLPIIMRNHDP